MTASVIRHSAGWKPSLAAPSGRFEEFFTRVPSTSKAGISCNRGKKQRAEIRRWARRNGYDLSGQRSIPPTVRRAYEEARVAASAKAPDPIAGSMHNTAERDDDAGSVSDSGAAAEYYGEEPVDGIDQHTRDRILQAYAAGATTAQVKATFNVSLKTARALRDDVA